MLALNFHRTATCILLTALVLFTGAAANADNNCGDGGCGGPRPPGPPIFVAPPEAGLPPMELPPGVAAPPQTTPVLPTPTFPPVLDDTGSPFPPGFFQAEATAVSAMTGFGTGHPAAAPAATDSAGATDFSLNVLAQQGGDFYSYTVPETAGAVQVTYVMRTGAHSQVLAAYESSAIGSILNSAATDFNGGLVDAQYDNDVLTSLIVTWEAAGHSHPFLYTPATGAAGSATALDFTSIDTLVNEHLDGPAKDAVLNVFHSAQSQYNTLAVPEPASFVLIALGIAIVSVGRAAQCNYRRGILPRVLGMALLTSLVLFTSAAATFGQGNTGGDNGGGQGCLPGEPCPIYVAPAIASLPPIELPPGFAAPPQATGTPAPTFPPVLNDTGDPFPPAFFQAEATATNAMTGFGTGHPAAAPAATDSPGAADFSLNLLAQQGGDFYSYTIPETAGAVQVTYVMRTGAHSQVLAAYESSAIGSILNSAASDFNGGLVDAQYDNDVLTSLNVTWEAAGHSHPFLYTPATGAAGSASALDFTSIESLVNDHLDGPAKDAVLGALHTAQAEYNTLAVPEPSAAILVGMAIVLAGARGWHRLSAGRATPLGRP